MDLATHSLSTGLPVSIGEDVWTVGNGGMVEYASLMGALRPDVLGAPGGAGWATVTVLTPDGLREVRAADYGLYVTVARD